MELFPPVGHGHALSGLCRHLARPSGAVVVIPNIDEYNAALKMLDNNKDAVKALFVDRYGAMSVDGTNEIDFDKAKDIITTSKEESIFIP